MKDLYSFLRKYSSKTTLCVADRVQSADCCAVHSTFISGSIPAVVGRVAGEYGGAGQAKREEIVSMSRVYKFLPPEYRITSPD